VDLLAEKGGLVGGAGRHHFDAVHLDQLATRHSELLERDLALDHRHLLEAGYRMLREVRFRVERLQVQCSDRVCLGNDPAEEIVKELRRRPYQMLVLGAVDRSTDAHLYVGSPIEAVLMRGGVPAVVLVARGG